jgi:acetate kinase
MVMRVLVLNPGSSTLKYRLVEVSAAQSIALAAGVIDQVSGSSLARAAEDVLVRCRSFGIDAVGCRVVHGGERFTEPTIVSASVLDAIADLGRLAPLHNPPAVAVLVSVADLLPGVPQVAVFDTAFHRAMPDAAALYALPLELARTQGLRRYGFHGTSHQFVTTRMLVHLGRTRPTRIITCHLGNGASITAVQDGQSIDTSMGLTPLEGLIMGTRSGDVDPGLLLHLLREEKKSADELDQMLNHRSGLLGIGGHADMRQLQAAARAGEARAILAMDMFTYRLRKYIGAYAAALEGLDAIAFTGGIGEHSSVIRQQVCDRLQWLGIQLDPARNEHPGDGEVRISLATSPVQVWIIPTDEEGWIARATANVLDPPFLPRVD